MNAHIRMLLTALVVVGVAASFAVPAFTEDEAEPAAPHGDGMTEAMAAMATPGPNHAWMGFMVGSWDVAAKLWMGPGEPQVSTATMESYWVMGRRYVRSNYIGHMGEDTFSGEATMGFNNAAERYETSWMDTMSTGISRSLGSREGDTIEVKGIDVNPAMGGEIPFRTVYTKKSDDQYMMESFWTFPGMGEVKGMELTFTRAK